MEYRAEFQRDRVQRCDSAAGVRIIDHHRTIVVVEQDVPSVKIAVLDTTRDADFHILDRREFDASEMRRDQPQGDISNETPPHGRHPDPLDSACSSGMPFFRVTF